MTEYLIEVGITDGYTFGVKHSFSFDDENEKTAYQTYQDIVLHTYEYKILYKMDDDGKNMLEYNVYKKEDLAQQSVPYFVSYIYTLRAEGMGFGNDVIDIENGSMTIDKIKEIEEQKKCVVLYYQKVE